MKIRPILFSTDMVKELLDERKTMTRRAVKYPLHYAGLPVSFRQGTEPHVAWCPYGEPGDILWVREGWRPAGGYDPGTDYGIRRFSGEPLYDFVYRADEGWNGPWRPSIHMPKVACRIWLKITNVRVERLHDITPYDAVHEGIKRTEPGDMISHPRYKDYMADASGYGDPDYDFPTTWDAVESFKTLWQKINGRTAWDENPWVWVVEFSKTDQPDNF